MKKSVTHRIARLALLTSAALILVLVEMALPPLLPFAPGAKMGFSNAVILVALILFGAPDALIILAAKLLLSAVFAGNPVALLYAVPAGVVSFLVQFLLYKFLFPKISLMSISLTGAILHNTVQLGVAGIIVGQSLFYIWPLLIFAGALAGLFIGFTSYFTVKYLPKSVYRLKKEEQIT